MYLGWYISITLDFNSFHYVNKIMNLNRYVKKNECIWNVEFNVSPISVDVRSTFPYGNDFHKLCVSLLRFYLQNDVFLSFTLSFW